MTVSVMVTGSLPRAPELKTSKAGKSYVFLTIKSSAGNEVEFWTVLAFGETEQAQLLRLGEGEKLAVQGSLKIEAKMLEGGEIKIRRTIFVDAVLSLKPKPREAKPKADKMARAAPARGETATPDLTARGRDFDDSIPF